MKLFEQFSYFVWELLFSLMLQVSMTRYILILLAGIVTLLALATALLSSAASLANGVANAAASTALLTSQCLSGFMVIVALVAGAAVGVTAYRLVSGRKAPLLLPPAAAPSPYPFIQVQTPQPSGYLPDSSQRLPAVYVPEQTRADEAESQDVLFRNWGW